MLIPADPAEVIRLREGQLAELPFPVLLHAFASAERTVVIELRRKNLQKRIVLEHGVPVDCRSNLVHETFGRFLVLSGRIDEDQFQTTFQESVRRGVPQGEVLAERGVIPPVELFKLLQQNLAKKLLDCFSWRDGEFRQLFDVPEVDSPLKVRVPQLLVTGISRFSQQEEVDQAIAPLVGKVLLHNPQSPTSLDDIRLGASQSLLTASLATGRRLDELAQLPGLGLEEVSRLVYGLRLLGLVITQEEARARGIGVRPPTARPSGAFSAPALGQTIPVSAQREVVESATPPGASIDAAIAALSESKPESSPAVASASPSTSPPPPTPTSARQAPPAAATQPVALPVEESAEKQRNELMQAYLAHRRQDAFELLGANELDHLPSITARYLATARRFAWWTWPRELETLADKGEELFLAAARAFAQLADSEQRNTLIYRRKTLREEKARRPVDLTIKTDLLDSELQFRKGMALLEEKKYKEAQQFLDFAADCDPQQGRYRAEAARCRFLLSPIVGGKQAIQLLREAVRMDPSCGIAHLYAGEIHRELGNLDEAETSLQKAIKLMSPDRRPIEALRTLRTKRR